MVRVRGGVPSKLLSFPHGCRRGRTSVRFCPAPRPQVQHRHDHGAHQQPEQARSQRLDQPLDEALREGDRVPRRHGETVEEVEGAAQAEILQPREDDVPAHPQHGGGADHRERAQQPGNAMHQPPPECRGRAAAPGEVEADVNEEEWVYGETMSSRLRWQRTALPPMPRSLTVF